MSTSSDANKPPADLERWKRGDSLTAKKFNEPVDAINRMTRGIALPQQVRKQATGRGSVVQRFKYVSFARDSIICVAWDGTTAGTENVEIARPEDLQRSPLDGQTRNGITYTYSSGFKRTATKGAESEVQIITPSYVAGDIIYGATNIVGQPFKVAAAVGFKTVEWLDINCAGRAWAKEAT